MLAREHKNNKDADKEEGNTAVHDVFSKYYRHFVPCYVFYACSVSGSSFHMALNSFTQFLDDCNIADNDSMAVKRSDLDTIFIVANFQVCTVFISITASCWDVVR